LETKEPVRFTFDPRRPAKLRGKEGTELRIKPGSLVFEDGSIPKTKRIEARLWEFYSSFDIMNAGLVTQSGKRMLETAGMIYVEAESDGQPLRLANGKSIDVSMPSPEGMSLFRGVEKEGVIDWQLPGALDPRPDKRNPLVSTDQRIVRTPRSEPYLRELVSRYEEENSKFDLNDYFSGSLGWINCDKFNARETVEYELIIDRSQLPAGKGKIIGKEEAPAAVAALMGLDNERVIAIFTDNRGVLRATRKDADRYLINVPTESTVTLVAINQGVGADKLYAGLTTQVDRKQLSFRRDANERENSITIKLLASSKDELKKATSGLW
jgi:hypothetical protein